jgi:hypothetical protein
LTSASTDRSETSCEQELVDRILASRHFIKAPLLSHFLDYVCRRTLQEGATRVSEQEIGVEVFRRAKRYDPKEDNIVRNYARQLRKRLDEYYATEGRTEELRVHIPKGSYLPQFTSNYGTTDEILVPAVTQAPGALNETPTAQHPVSNDAFRWVHARIAFLVVIAMAALIAATAFHARHYRTALFVRRTAMPSLWTQLFAPNRDTVLVPADTGFVTLQEIKRRSFSLAEYASWSSFERPIPGDFKTKKYTSVVDLEIMSRLERLPEVTPERFLIRAARNLTIEDLRDKNAIFLGSVCSIPWIELFQNRLNFHFIYRPAETISWIENEHPAADEAAKYTASWNGLSERTYAVLAFLPNLNKTGHILLLQGLDTAGTEAAVNFLFSDDRLREVVEKARRTDGALGSFEVLLEAASLDSHATTIHVLSVRTSN